MAVTIKAAEKIVLEKLPQGSVVKSAIEYEGKYLFIAYRPDPFEGFLDPFFSVEKDTGFFRDFNPTDYDNSLEVLNSLDSAFRE